MNKDDLQSMAILLLIMLALVLYLAYGLLGIIGEYLVDLHYTCKRLCNALDTAGCLSPYAQSEHAAEATHMGDGSEQGAASRQE